MKKEKLTVNKTRFVCYSYPKVYSVVEVINISWLGGGGARL